MVAVLALAVRQLVYAAPHRVVDVNMMRAAIGMSCRFVADKEDSRSQPKATI